jgi:hypothetical protein
VKSIIHKTRRLAALLSLVACWITSALPLRAEDGKPAPERELADRYLYFYRIGLAEREWAANNVPRAAEVLDECPPPPETLGMALLETPVRRQPDYLQRT